MLKKMLASLFLLLFLSLTGFLIHSSLQPQKLPVGALMPALQYQAVDGSIQTLEIDSLRSSMMIYFHSDCKYCKYELGLLNKNISLFTNTRLTLLTPETDFFELKKMRSWPKLVNSSVLSWGLVDGEEFKEKLGGKGFPSTYIFDNEGLLKTKTFGKSRLEKLLSELKKNPGGPELQVSGHN